MQRDYRAELSVVDIAAEEMSGGYIRSTVCDSPMERRIYKLARQGDSTETFSPSMFPKPSTAAPPPRIRILLAPYMVCDPVGVSSHDNTAN